MAGSSQCIEVYPLMESNKNMKTNVHFIFKNTIGALMLKVAPLWKQLANVAVMQQINFYVLV